MGVYILETGVGGQERIKKKWEKNVTIQQQARLAPRARWVMCGVPWGSCLPERSAVTKVSYLPCVNTPATGHKRLLINWNVDSIREELKIFNSSNWKDFISNCVSVCGFVHMRAVCGDQRALEPMELLESLVLLRTARCGSSGRPASALHSSGPWLNQILDNLNIQQVATLQANASLRVLQTSSQRQKAGYKTHSIQYCSFQNLPVLFTHGPQVPRGVPRTKWTSHKYLLNKPTVFGSLERD